MEANGDEGQRIRPIGMALFDCAQVDLGPTASVPAHGGDIHGAQAEAVVAASALRHSPAHASGLPGSRIAA